MELAKYKACICEGSAENAIIDIHLDYMDCGGTPLENSQYWVAPFVTDFIQKHKNVLDKNCDEYLRQVPSMEI